MTIGDIILEPMTIHRVGGNSQKRKERVRYLLERVGLNPDWYHRYPHQLSGGKAEGLYCQGIGFESPVDNL